MTNKEVYKSLRDAEDAWLKKDAASPYLQWLEEEFVPETKMLQHTPIFDLVEIKDPGIIGFNPVKINSVSWITICVEKDGKWLMEKQLRYGLMSRFTEFPSGMIEDGEDPIVAAKRELKEETGYDVDVADIKYLGKFAANPAFMSNYMHYFYVNLDVAKWTLGNKELDAHEKIETLWKDKNEVLNQYFIDEDSVFKAGLYLRMQKEGLI